MNTRLSPVLTRLAILVAAILGGYLLLQTPARDFEANAARWVVNLSGSQRAVSFGQGSVLVEPAHHLSFVAIVTPSCSSISSVLAIVCLASLMRYGSRARRFGALAVAVGVVVAGNVLRIAASLEIGLIYGRSSLVLFHDFIGSIFTFIYILGGYVLMLYLLLPDKRRAEASTVEVAHA